MHHLFFDTFLFLTLSFRILQQSNQLVKKSLNLPAFIHGIAL